MTPTFFKIAARHLLLEKRGLLVHQLLEGGYQRFFPAHKTAPKEEPKKEPVKELKKRPVKEPVPETPVPTSEAEPRVKDGPKIAPKAPPKTLTSTVEKPSETIPQSVVKPTEAEAALTTSITPPRRVVSTAGSTVSPVTKALSPTPLGLQSALPLREVAALLASMPPLRTPSLPVSEPKKRWVD